MFIRRSAQSIALLLAVTVAGGAAQAQQHDAVRAIRVDTIATLEIGSGGLTVHPDGSIFLADFGSRLGGDGEGGHRVMKVSPDGVVQPFATGLVGASGNELVGGTLFQSNIGGNLVSAISSAGEVTEFAREGLSNPVGIASDPDGNLFVANCGDGSIQKLTPGGESSRIVKHAALRCPNGITIDPAGNLYVANFYDGKVLKVSQSGTISALTTLPGENNGHLVFHDGALWVVARSAHRIYRVTLTGDAHLVAGSGEMGGKDGPAMEAEFTFPNDIGFSPDGRYLYVNDVVKTSDDGRDLAPTRLRRIEIDQGQ